MAVGYKKTPANATRKQQPEVQARDAKNADPHRLHFGLVWFFFGKVAQASSLRRTKDAN
jgi:hypothetical protein